MEKRGRNKKEKQNNEFQQWIRKTKDQKVEREESKMIDIKEVIPQSNVEISSLLCKHH